MNIADLKMLIECTSNDPTKPILNLVYCDGNHAYSTDGYRAYRTEFKHESEPFCVNVKYLKQVIKATKKRAQPKIELSAKVENHDRYPDIARLFPNHQSKIDIPLAVGTNMINSIALWDLPLIAIKFEDKKIRLAHGIGGRWLRDTIDIPVIHSFDPKLPVFNFACKYIEAMNERLYAWDTIEYGKHPSILFTNSKTRSTYLVMQTDIRKGCEAFN